MRHRTKAGILLEKILHETKHRYLFCWNGESEDGEDSLYDCACCMTWIDEESMRSCGCICHERFEEMANQRHIKLWLLSLDSFDRMPRFFTTFEEKLEAAKDTAKGHQAQLDRCGMSPTGVGEPCECEDCLMVKRATKNGYVAPTTPTKTCEVCSKKFTDAGTHVWCPACIQDTIQKELES